MELVKCNCQWSTEVLTGACKQVLQHSTTNLDMLINGMIGHYVIHYKEQQKTNHLKMFVET